MIRTILTLVSGAALAVSLTACSSGENSGTITGTSGSITATSPTEDGKAPEVELQDAPFSVDETTVEVIKEGDGEVVPKGAVVSVNYHGVNGRDGNSFDSSYTRNEPAQFPLDRVVVGFSKAIEGQKVGTKLVAAMPPADGYGVDGQPGVGIQGTDTLVFFIDIVEIVGQPDEQPAPPMPGEEGAAEGGDGAEGGATDAPPTPGADEATDGAEATTPAEEATE